MLAWQYWPSACYLYATRASWQAAANDAHFQSMHLVGLAALVLSALLGCFCDALRLLPQSWRCQPYSDAPGPAALFADAVPVAIANGALGHWPASVPLFRLWQRNGGPLRSAAASAAAAATAAASSSSSPDLLSSLSWLGGAARDFALMALVIEVHFYWTHWLLHQKVGAFNLYALIHKQHHRFTAPTALCVSAPAYAYLRPFWTPSIVIIIII
jgi:sterol desaturase/sphingolipid hydroxylase (fatty acid hydroxylase superfamily)